MGKKSFILGGIVGFILGTRAGREQYEKMKSSAQNLWEMDAVQQGVAKVEDTVGGVARNSASNLTDKVAGMVKEKIHSTGRPKADDSMAGHVSGGEEAMDPATPGPRN
ncbi:MAG: hypothetical protein Q4Q03_00355 [Bowdeniella nasicola]|nr:hypothetical protein [Bowdeniella nasicola]